jgi:hypothetical protein
MSIAFQAIGRLGYRSPNGVTIRQTPYILRDFHPILQALRKPALLIGFGLCFIPYFLHGVFMMVLIMRKRGGGKTNVPGLGPVKE